MQEVTVSLFLFRVFVLVHITDHYPALFRSFLVSVVDI